MKDLLEGLKKRMLYEDRLIDRKQMSLADCRVPSRPDKELPKDNKGLTESVHPSGYYMALDGYEVKLYTDYMQDFHDLLAEDIEVLNRGGYIVDFNQKTKECVITRGNVIAAEN